MKIILDPIAPIIPRTHQPTPQIRQRIIDIFDSNPLGKKYQYFIFDDGFATEPTSAKITTSLHDLFQTMDGRWGQYFYTKDRRDAPPNANVLMTEVGSSQWAATTLVLHRASLEMIGRGFNPARLRAFESTGT